jgi:predicted nucleic acid-binding protein
MRLSSRNTIAVNPTIIHETYHTLVYGQKWVPSIAKDRLQLILRHPHVEFHNQTKIVSNVALNLAVRFSLGGRDALILANYLVNRVSRMFTHDSELLKMRKVTWRDQSLRLEDPLTK